MIGALANVLAPRIEIGQQALDEAFSAKDAKRVIRIIERATNRQSSLGSSGGGGIDDVQKVDINAPDKNGLRPIHRAACAGMADVVQRLLEAGVHVDTLGAEANTALHLAVFHEQDGVVAVLVEGGASPRQENARGKTAVDLARTETS
ncbi:unnamed protein product, partial [Discosporangium mesarthrocarpum]